MFSARYLNSSGPFLRRCSMMNERLMWKKQTTYSTTHDVDAMVNLGGKDCVFSRVYE